MGGLSSGQSEEEKKHIEFRNSIVPDNTTGNTDNNSGVNNAFGNTGQSAPQTEPTPQQDIPNPTQPPKKNLQDIDVSTLDQEDKNVFTVDWGPAKESKQYGFFEGPTAPSTQPVDQPQSSGFSGGISNPSGSTLNMESMRNGVKVFILAIDFGMAKLLSWFAGDKNLSPYKAQKEDIKIMETSMVQILEESKLKIPTWLIVTLAILSAYAFQAMAAYVKWKDNKEHKEKLANLAKANAELERKNAELERQKAATTQQQQTKTPTGQQQTQATPPAQQQTASTVQSQTQTPPEPNNPTPDTGVGKYWTMPDGTMELMESDHGQYGKFWKDGIEYRRYDNGSIKPTKYHPVTKKEIRKGKPGRNK